MAYGKEVLLKLVRTRFGECRESGEELIVHCPFCVLRGQTVDRKGKLYINATKDFYHCFRCDVAGRASELFPQIASLGAVIERVERNLPADKELEPIPESFGLEQLPPGHLAVDFIKHRGFTTAELSGRVLFCKDYRKVTFSFGPRIVFPIYQFGTYRGFQARTIYNNTEPKYIGATNMSKKTILYNFDEAFSQDEELVITEGFFDCLRVGPTAVAAMGKAISKEQIQLIKLGNFKRVVILLDKDAKKEIQVTAHELAPFFNTYAGYLPAKDPSEMKKDELRCFLDTKVERIF